MPKQEGIPEEKKKGQVAEKPYDPTGLVLEENSDQVDTSHRIYDKITKQIVFIGSKEECDYFIEVEDKHLEDRAQDMFGK